MGEEPGRGCLQRGFNKLCPMQEQVPASSFIRAWKHLQSPKQKEAKDYIAFGVSSPD